MDILGWDEPGSEGLVRRIEKMQSGILRSHPDPAVPIFTELADILSL